MMAKSQILPAAIRYQTELAQNVAALKSAGVNGSTEVLSQVTAAIGDLTKGISALEKAHSHHADGSPYDHAKHMRNDVFPALNTLRTAADKLETLVADDLWPLPTYREMLFIK
jgi:glutamine synthetase